MNGSKQEMGSGTMEDEFEKFENPWENGNDFDDDDDFDDEDDTQELGDEDFEDDGTSISELIGEPESKREQRKNQPKGVVSIKRARKPLSPREKVLRVIMRRAGVETIPTLDSLMRGKGGERMRICDIGLFISGSDDEVLSKISELCPVTNRVNLSAEIQINQVKKVGSDILSSGRMYQPIQVARIEEDGAMECTSGRHRLAFLALTYGPTVSIPVYVEEMTIQEARDAVVVANQARSTKAMEKAEHAVMKAVHGDVDAGRDELYRKMAVSKGMVRKYCVYNVLREYPVALDFMVSLTASRKGGAMTTVTNVEKFWSNALNWHKDMPRKDFDAELKDATVFLNAVVKAMQKDPGMDAHQHLATMSMHAIGKYYNELQNVTGNAIEKAGDIASVVVGMGDCARHKYDAIYHELRKAMRKK